MWNFKIKKLLKKSPYKIKYPIEILVKKEGKKNFIAWVPNTTLAMSGFTIKDVVKNLKALITRDYELMLEVGEEKLGPAKLFEKRFLDHYLVTPQYKAISVCGIDPFTVVDVDDIYVSFSD